MTETAEGLFERESELEQIGSGLERARDDRGACLLVEGPAGIGKSRLLNAAAVMARERGFEVLRSRGGALERDFSYGLVRQLLEREVIGASPADREKLLSGAAERAAPALGVAHGTGAQSVEASFPVIHGLYWLVSNLAAEQPLLLVVDDAHWADASSLRFLLYLVPRLDGLPVAVVTGVRAPEPGVDEGLIAQFRSDQAAEMVRPAPLSRNAIATLIADRFDSPAAPAFVDSAYEATGGNPFLLSELLAVLAADGGSPTAEAASRIRQLGPETVSRSLLLRLAALPSSCAQLARALAVLGAEAELASAASLAGLTADEAARAADELVTIDVIADGRPLQFKHPILREAIYSDLPESDRQTQHIRAVAVLRDEGASADELAPHLLIAEPAQDAATVASLREAAAGALDRGAADSAQRHLRRALAEPPEDALQAEVLEELGTAEWLAGEDIPTAIDHMSEAVDLSEGALDRARRVLSLSRAIFFTGDVNRAFEVLKRHVDELKEEEGEEILRLGAELGSFAILYPPLVDRNRARMERFLGLEEPTAAELLHVSNLATWAYIEGSAEEAAELAEESLGGGRLIGFESSDSFPLYQSVYTLVWADQYELVDETLDATLADAQARGSVFGFTCCSTVRAIAAWRRGDVSGCEAEARNGIALGIMPPIVRPTVYTYLALALITRGELDEAEWAVTESGCGEYLPKLVHFNPAFYGRARLRLAQGRPEEALADALELGDRDAELELLNPGTPWRAVAAEAQLALGETDEAVRLAEEHLAAAKAWGAPSIVGVAEQTLGLVQGPNGIPTLEQAVEMLANSPARLDHAAALVDLGSGLRRGGKRREAREPLRQGLDLARRCAATALVERAHAELVTAGARPRRLMFSGAESLTASERRVALMAADGQSNRDIAQALFVTVKTVETHLGRAYNKLGISSRKEIAKALAEPAEGS